MRSMVDRWAARITRLWTDRGGMVAIMTAIGAVVLMGFAGLAIDVVSWELVQHKMQSAADAAALAGSITANIPTSTSQNVTDAVDAMAANYGFVNGQNGTSVTVTLPSNEVAVVISQPQPQFFSRFFLGTAPTVTVQAAANLPAGSGDMCVMTLDASGKLAVGSTTFTGNTTVNMSNCDLYNNSVAANSTELNGSSILDVRNMYLAGDYTVGGSASLSMSGAAATYVTPALDPYAGMTIPSYSSTACNTYSDTPTSNITITPSGSTPYVICGNMDVHGKLTLNPGTYILNGGSFTAEAQAAIQGTGVTIILTSNTGSYGTVDIKGGATVSLTAPAAGAPAGVPGIALWVDKNAPYAATDNLNGGSSQNINGVIYMPDQQVSFNGGSNQATTCLQLIALDVTFSGNTNTYITQSGCSADNLPIKQPPLPPSLAS
jgi:Flp pilus assembly protein TadG